MRKLRTPVNWHEVTGHSSQEPCYRPKLQEPGTVAAPSVTNIALNLPPNPAPDNSAFVEAIVASSSLTAQALVAAATINAEGAKRAAKIGNAKKSRWPMYTAAAVVLAVATVGLVAAANEGLEGGRSDSPDSAGGIPSEACFDGAGDDLLCFVNPVETELTRGTASVAGRGLTALVKNLDGELVTTDPDAIGSQVNEALQDSATSEEISQYMCSLAGNQNGMPVVIYLGDQTVFHDPVYVTEGC